MKEVRLAKQYARALVEAARARGLLERVEQDLESFVGTLAIEEWRLFLADIRIPLEQRMQVLERVFGPHVDSLTLSFLKLVLRHRRQRLLPTIASVYRQMAVEARQEVEAEIYSARPLGADELEQIRGGLESFTGRRVRLRPVVDHSLLGGVRVQIEDLIIDGSVRSRLRQLEEKMLRAGMNGSLADAGSPL
ncbi:MAG: ATP synthase F1 subunit delta [Limnochordales bacterium]|nr:ATP synthase F1 subunit delta [Limnochordales bacterium]